MGLVAVGIIVVGIIAAGVAGGVLALGEPGGGDPRESAPIVTVQPLPDDVRAEIDTTWSRFAAVFPARLPCMDEVELILVDDVEGGDARYLVPERRIEIEIPTSPRRFRESLAHELAHHLEHTCDEFDGLRRQFTGLAGFAPGPWDRGPRWEQTPAELWAETVVVAVHGERIRSDLDMPLPEGAEALVRAWGQGPAS